MKLRHKLPEEIAEEIQLDRDEKALAWATDPQGRHIVATNLGLVLQRHPPQYERLSWETIDGARFGAGELSLRLVPRDGTPGETISLPIGDVRDLPVAVRDRVTASIVVNQHIALRGRHGVRIVARRRPADGMLLWTYLIDSALDPDPELIARAEAALDDFRRDSGVE